MQRLCRIKVRGTKTCLDKFILVVKDAKVTSSEKLLAILVGLTDGGKFNWSKAVSNPVVYDYGAWYRFHNVVCLIRSLFYMQEPCQMYSKEYLIVTFTPIVIVPFHEVFVIEQFAESGVEHSVVSGALGFFLLDCSLAYISIHITFGETTVQPFRVSLIVVVVIALPVSITVFLVVFFVILFAVFSHDFVT